MVVKAVNQGAEQAAPVASGGLEPFERVQRETISTEIARRLLAYLLSGEIQPGGRLPSERRLAEMLRVGRSVVREALKSLTLLGLIEVRQGDGTYLRGTESSLLPQSVGWGLLLGHKQTRDLVEARRHLEEILAGLAAERRTDADLRALHHLLDEMRASDEDPDRFVAADVAFHLTVTQAARNETLGGVVAGIRTLLHVWISRVMHAADNFEPSVREHAAILTALDDADPVAARRAMRDHMDGAVHRLESTLPPIMVAGVVGDPAGPDADPLESIR